MIAKRIDMREASKSRATRLAKYVTDEFERAGRVAEVFIANCISDDVLLAAKEIEICQAKNTRTKDDKTYHLLLSFPDGERPGADHLREIATAAAKALGYADHQRIAVVHDDTDNLHIHLIINKIHPTRHTIHTPRRDFKILAELCAKLERDNSQIHTHHEPRKSATEAKARDMEAHSGQESFLSYTKEKALPILAAAQSWDELHRGLAEVGISLRLRGNGLVIVDHTGTVAVKASTVSRDFSKAKLEKRLGAFVPYDTSRTTSHTEIPPPEKPLSTYQKSPQPGTSQLYQQYKQANEAAEQKRKTELATLWEQQKQTMQRIAATAKLNLPKAASYHLKRNLRLQARNAANAAIADVRRTMTAKRQEISARHKPLGYIEWLKREAEHGNIPAIYALRKRGAVAPALINITARDLRDIKLIAAKIVHVTGRGTLFYRAGQDVFRDNGSHVSVKRDVSDAGIHSALLIAMAKFNGQPLAVNGTDEFKERCVMVAAREGLVLAFSDPALERERQNRRPLDVERVTHSQAAQKTREKEKEHGLSAHRSIQPEPPPRRQGMTR
jgi:hypothetical protein